MRSSAATRGNYGLQQCLGRAWPRVWLLALCRVQPLSRALGCAGSQEFPPDGAWSQTSTSVGEVSASKTCQHQRTKPRQVAMVGYQESIRHYLSSLLYLIACLSSSPEVFLHSVFVDSTISLLSEAYSETSYAFCQHSCSQNFLLLSYGWRAL